MLNPRLNTITVDSGAGGYKTAEDRKKDDTPKDTTPKTPSYSSGGSYYNTVGAFKPSAAYTQAMNYTNSLLEKLNSGKTSYSDKIDALMGQIENREKFSYDFNTDPLFQNALQGAMAAGQTAMQDTIGQASALTGGYGSSYATSAANQAYNQYVKGAYDNLPEYYALAKDAYDQEGQELYNRLGMYRTADDTEYSRLSNAYAMNLSNAESMYNKEYSNYWDTNNYNFNVAQANNDLAYKYASLAQSQRNSDRDFAEKQRQYNLSLAEEQRQFNAKSSTSGSSGLNANGYKDLTSDIQKGLIASIQNNGPGQNSQLWDAISTLEAQGYDPNQIDYLVDLYAPNAEYSINGWGQYEDQFGNKINASSGAGRGQYETASFSLVSGKKKKDGSVYVDERTGKTYSYQELVENGWNRFIR